MNLHDTVTEFLAAFNRDSLDDVMAFFAEEACYITVNGRKAQGKSAVRDEFSAQFEGKFGRLRFWPEHILIDVSERKAVSTWQCEHAFSRPPFARGFKKWGRFFMRLVLGKKTRWSGLDVLFFNEQGLIIEKRTYAQTHLPLFRSARQPLKLL